MTDAFRLENGILEVLPGTEYLESEKFAENNDIVKVILPEGLKHVSIACFTSCEALEEINIPSTVKSIDDGAFLSCHSLREIVFPEGLLEIADLSFQDTALERVTVPASVRTIGAEAFFECENLREANVLGEDTEICENAFGSDYNLLQGFIAPGFPVEEHPGTELLFSLLWATCPDRHSEKTGERAAAFIKKYPSLIMERILKFNNVYAMTGIANRRLLEPQSIDEYVRKTTDLGLTELTALLIKAKGESRDNPEEFEL